MPPLPFPTGPQEFEQSGTRYRVVPVVRGLVNPWSLTFLPNGDMLVTERPGRLRIVRNGTLDPQPIAGIPAGLGDRPGRTARSAAAPAVQPRTSACT